MSAAADDWKGLAGHRPTLKPGYLAQKEMIMTDGITTDEIAADIDAMTLIALLAEGFASELCDPPPDQWWDIWRLYDHEVGTGQHHPQPSPIDLARGAVIFAANLLAGFDLETRQRILAHARAGTMRMIGHLDDEDGRDRT
jgi:hypothetical protein